MMKKVNECASETRAEMICTDMRVTRNSTHNVHNTHRHAQNRTNERTNEKIHNNNDGK